MSESAETQSKRRGEYPQAKGRTLGGAVHAGRAPVTGKAIYKNVLGKTQAEVKEKFKAAIEKSAVRPMSMEYYTVGQWLDVWMENYSELQVRRSSYKTYQGFISNHIKLSLVMFHWKN